METDEEIDGDLPNEKGKRPFDIKAKYRKIMRTMTKAKEEEAFRDEIVAFKYSTDMSILRRCTPEEVWHAHPMIQSLNIAGCHAITDIGISRLATQSREHLVQLNVSGCIKITPESIAIIASHCRQLKRLNLSNIKSIDDECIRVLWRNCPQMEKLCLKECDQLTDAAFKALGFVWPKLDHLDLTYCSKVGDAGMLQVATYCPVLRMLRMTGCKLSLPCLRRATTINDQLHINIEQE
eukprot:gene7657-5506_t